MKDIGFKMMTFLMIFLVPISVLADPITTDPTNPSTGDTTIPSTPEVPSTGDNTNPTPDISDNNNQSNSQNNSDNAGDVIYQQNQNTSRSTNANLGSLKVDGVDIAINNEMYATTGNENPSIVAIPSSD